MPLGRINPIEIARRLPARLAREDDPRVQRAYVAGRQVVRRVVNIVPGVELGWVGVLGRARWRDDTTFEIVGWAYERGYGYPDSPPIVEVSLHSQGQRPLVVTAQTLPERLANTRMRNSRIDYANTGFVATFDLDRLVQLGGGRDRLWTVRISVSDGKRTRRGHFRRRRPLSSALQLSARTFAGVQVVPQWDERMGLRFWAGRPVALAIRAGLSDRPQTADLQMNGITATAATLISPQGRTPLRLDPQPMGRLRVSGTVPEIDPDGPTSLSDPDEDEGLQLIDQIGGYTPETSETSLPVLSYTVEVTDDRNRRHTVAAALDSSEQAGGRKPPPFLYPGPEGSLRVRDTPAMMVVDSAEVVTTPELGVRVAGRVLGDLDGAELSLIGPRARRPMEIKVAPDGSFTGYASWLATTWGESKSPPLSGRYTLRGQTAEGRWFRVAATIGTMPDAPVVHDLPGFTCTMGVAPGRRLAFQLSPPLREHELGAFNQDRLQRIYHKGSRPAETAFYFESFNGRQATCNPYAIDRELAVQQPDIPRYWGVTDASIAVPEGSIPVVFGTEDWWRARQTSRFVVANEWLKNRYRHLPEQVVLQTWHGTMLKRIGLDRAQLDVLTRRSLLEERTKWDFLLSQNPHSTEIFRSAYAWEKEIWEEGYPRNDALTNETGERVRRLLGIEDGRKAVLYAPTWRENQTEMVTFLDLERLTADLGEEYVLLLRGHSRTMAHGADVHVPGVIDVTSYPHITDLFGAADALITDYSSVMFDYSATGRPMIFFVPDMDDYRDSLRGVYFDLSESAPGPVLATQDEVLDAVRRMESDVAVHRPRYDAWQQRFNPHDDGQAAKRVLDRLLALG